MRFLCKFDDLQVNKWSHHYAQYRLLRTLVRVTSIDEANASQQKDQARVTEFHSNFISLLNLQVDSLIEEFNIPPGLRCEVPEEFSLTFVEQYCVLQSLIELREIVKEFHCFEYVNEQAFRLLRQKLERKAGSHHQTRLGMFHSLFKNRNDRTRLLEWIELAIKFVEVNSSQEDEDSKMFKSLDSAQRLALLSQKSHNRKAYAHRLIQKVGRTVVSDTPASTLFYGNGGIPTVGNDDDLDVELSKMFSNSGFIRNSALQELDDFKRLPLHYAVQYGLVNTVRTILQRMRQGRTSFGESVDPPLSLDCFDHSPLHVALLRDHMSILELLLAQCVESKTLINTRLQQSNLTILAMKMKSRNAIDLFVRYNVGVDYRDTEGRTVLHYAAWFGQDRVLPILIQETNITRLNEADKNGLSPLIYASIYGHSDAVQVLLEGGADPQAQDLRGWTAKEYAAHKGHVKLAYLLNESSPPVRTIGMSAIALPVAEEIRQRSVANVSAPKCDKSANNVPSSDGNFTVVINMGSLDSRKPYVDLQLATASTQLGLAVQLSAHGNLTQFFQEAVSLPILESTVNRPYIISTKDLSSFQLVFTLLNVESPGNPTRESNVLGSAVAIAQTFGHNLGQHRESLMRETTIPILNGENRLLGTLTFSFLVVSPFLYSQVTSNPQHLCRIKGKSNIIGHRGNGQNALRKDRSRVQLGENTMQSFKSAHSLGVTVVEFDVQMTADLVPLVYHDFQVSETGTDVPVHIVSLDQFRQISRSQQNRGSRTSMAEKHYTSKIQTEKRQRPRAFSMDAYDERRMADVVERLKETYQYRLKGFKGNTRGDYVQEPINTLEELLSELPPTLGFNVELKYPMLFEADDWHMPIYSIEINTYVDKILELCFKFGGDRQIILSSFSPEVCIALKIKQQTYPVVFISDGGLFATGDLRASNFQEGIHFAKRWDLAGVAMMADPFVLSHKLVDYVKEAGLFTISHGNLNNDPKYVMRQAKFGVDSLIVDDIVRITRSLEQPVSGDETKGATELGP